MNSPQVPASLRNIVAATLEVTPDVVTPELDASSIESWDSLRHIQLILALESEFGVEFDPQDIADLTSVSAIQRALLEQDAKL